MKPYLLAIIMLSLVTSHTMADTNSDFVSDKTISNTLSKIYKKSEISNKIVERGVRQVAKLWQPSDGTNEDFLNLCEAYSCKTKEDKQKLFERIEAHFETILGYNNLISMQLLRPTHVVGYENLKIDDIFSAYNPNANFNDDMFKNKIAFIVILNFPYYTLEEKIANGDKWTEQEWGYVRLGDIFTSRVTAEINQQINTATAQADNYISNYNIPMGKLLGPQFVRYWPWDMKLISHWGLRDEIKAQYAASDGYEKQKLIYHTMLHIIKQDVPVELFETNDYLWHSPSNGIYLGEIEVVGTPDKNLRYQHLLNIFQAMKNSDPYYPNYKNYVERKFNTDLEIPVEEVEKLFTTLITSPQVKEVAQMISKRLGRKLQPFDIWYDGFKTRSNYDPAYLDSITKSKYPTHKAFEKDLPNILMKLGYSAERAKEICSHITVDPSVGAGHAWGAEMKSAHSLLRTRVSQSGMDYKGYNIGVHEFGHNVEQTISLHDVHNYFLHGVPNTAFTEALAFTFQGKDLELLGIPSDDPLTEALNTLDLFWGCYEIMGVSLVDIKVWQWMYSHPYADANELKDAVIQIAKDVWNQYYAPVFGTKDIPILAIYSHMIDAPLYLSAYPIGHIIDFQLETYLKGKDLAQEIDRIFAIGRLTPDLWMQKAVGEKVSVQPLITATGEAVAQIKEGEKAKKKNKR